ncbi:De-etiolated protein 1 [Theobroma cacao]|nr:De-etiolated protein 1 [Theobroma cacao]
MPFSFLIVHLLSGILLIKTSPLSCMLLQLISATDRHRQVTDHPIRFISRRQPNNLKFKIKPGPEFGNADGRSKKISYFLFHPFLPLALSIQQTLFLPPSVVNIHFRR